jgi:hypothetical protein
MGNKLDVKNDFRMAMVMTRCDLLEEISRGILFLNEQERK